MFDFLNKLTHDHHSPQPTKSPPQAEHNFINSSSASEDEQLSFNQEGEISTVIVLRKEVKRPKPEDKKLKVSSSIVAKMQEGVKASLDPAVKAALSDMLRGSQMGLGSLVLDNVKKVKDSTEKKVYIREMSRCQQEYLEETKNAVKFQNYFVGQGISSTITAVIDQIAIDIENQKLQPRLKRKRFLQNAEEKKIEALKIIKMQESQLQEKIGELRVELREEDILDRRAKEIMDKQQFSTDNIKTKMAEEFVKELQKEKEDKKAKLQEMKERKRSIELQMKEEQKIVEEKAKEQRHLKLVEQFLQKQKAKQEKEEQSRVQQLNFQKFLKQYKAYKPLYKKKQEQFCEAQKQQKRQRYNILKQNQAKYEPLSIETLDIHEQKYSQLRKQDRERKSAQINYAKQVQKLRKKELEEKVYKGRFRYLILQEMVQADVKKKQIEDEKKYILAKKQAYSLEVKERYKPTIDPAKRHEIEELINSHRGRKRKYMTPKRVAYSQRNSTIGSRQAISDTATEPDPKEEGKRYHRLFKQYIKDKIDRGEIRQSKVQSLETIQPRAPDYLKEMRQKYSDKIPSRSQRLDREIAQLKEGEDYRILMLRAEDYENKAKMREQKIRNAPHKPEEQARLQQQYLCAIKAKMQLISNID